jgi:MFS family permease
LPDTRHSHPQDTNSANDLEQLDSLETREADVEVAPTSEVVSRGGTFESFRYRDFSLFWAGAFVSNTGSWMQNYALAIVVYSLRRSELDSGLVNFVSGIPVLFLALPGGALADRVDKRRLLIVSQAIMLLQATALGILYSTGHLTSQNAVASLAWIAALGLLGGVMSALTFPAWQSLLPDLVPKKALLNAIALNSAQFQSARLLGPLAAAGLVLLGAGMGQIFYVNAASFLFVIAALWAIRPHPSHAEETAAADARHASGRPADMARESSWRTLTAGLRYARENRTIGVLIGSTAVMTIFGMPYMMLLPAYADKVLGGGKTETAYLMAANGLGAVIGALVVAGLRRNTRRERLIPLTLVAFSLLLIAFSLSTSLALSLVISAFAGASVLTINSLTNTSIQAAVPGQIRGRVMALFIMAFMGLMPVSSLIFGPIGEAIGPAKAILGGAVVLLGWSIYLVARPSLLTPVEGTL